jgi:hypothetical protein
MNVNAHKKDSYTALIFQISIIPSVIDVDERLEEADYDLQVENPWRCSQLSEKEVKKERSN